MNTFFFLQLMNDESQSKSFLRQSVFCNYMSRLGSVMLSIILKFWMIQRSRSHPNLHSQTPLVPSGCIDLLFSSGVLPPLMSPNPPGLGLRLGLPGHQCHPGTSSSQLRMGPAHSLSVGYQVLPRRSISAPPWPLPPSASPWNHSLSSPPGSCPSQFHTHLQNPFQEGWSTVTNWSCYAVFYFEILLRFLVPAYLLILAVSLVSHVHVCYHCNIMIIICVLC